MRRWIIALLIAVAAGLALLVLMVAQAKRDPVVRTLDLTVAAATWEGGPLRIALLTDLHVAGPDMPPRKLARIVARVNALRPDLVVLTGDFLSRKPFTTRVWEADQSLAPLKGLRARLGAVAVFGNHDHQDGLRWIRMALRAAGVTVLENDAVRRGPLVVMGIDDPVTGHEDVWRTEQRAQRLGPGPRLLLSHSPSIAPWAPPGTALVLAGHTHCGQIRLPGIGPIGGRYRAPVTCGAGRYRDMTIVVGAGLGTSNLPLRLGTPSDIWLVTLRPAGGEWRPLSPSRSRYPSES